jgi:hypothetical protein
MKMMKKRAVSTHFGTKMVEIFSSYLDEMGTKRVLFFQVKGCGVSNLAKS